VDLRRPLSPETVAAIDSGMDEYAVLVFRGQDISDEEQLAFSRAPRDSISAGSVPILRMSPIWIKTRISMPGTTDGDYLI